MIPIKYKAMAAWQVIIVMPALWLWRGFWFASGWAWPAFVVIPLLLWDGATTFEAWVICTAIPCVVWAYLRGCWEKDGLPTPRQIIHRRAKMLQETSERKALQGGELSEVPDGSG